MSKGTTKDSSKNERNTFNGRVGVPGDIARMVACVCSDDASYCTGHTYFVDGGWLLVKPSMD